MKYLVATIFALFMFTTPIQANTSHWNRYCKHHYSCYHNHPWVFRNNPHKRYWAWRHWCVKHQVCLNKHPNFRPEGTWEVDFLTAYCPGDGSGFITADGSRVYWGEAAAEPDIPFGTRYYIPAYGMTFTVHDRGGLVGDGHLDIWYPTNDPGCHPALTGNYKVERLN